MEIKCTSQELIELIENKKETPVAGTTDVPIRLDGINIANFSENHD